jgi:HPt (histidine-containing phosphotransfer) domain-containing protein
MDPIMAQLRARYVASFPEKHALLQAAWQAIPTHPGAKLDLRVLCHKLAGSAPMYEFHELGRAAREACDAIDANAETEALGLRITQLLAQLERE